ncbi:TetR/AcrR family transcriptional regulator [Butyricicoccus pullicaecorum]|uniref:TetR/AcrR family transcriptional regulator n=1 Tax=Butyricicoccus pullicaecorum TaxID=501571 RepID=UPI003520BB9A
MAKGPSVNYEEVHHKALRTAALLFLEKGYTATSIHAIAAAAGVGQTSVMRTFGSKEGILCELVKFVLDGQFAAARAMLNGVTDDLVLYYATETAMQLYMAESDESVRDLYAAAYTMPESAELIRRTVSDELLGIVFKDYLPGLEHEDFYMLEIATGSMIRGYMTVPCTPDLPIEKKVQSFLENSLRVFRLPEEKIREAVTFIRQFDYPTIAKQTIDNMLVQLETAFE